MVSGALHFFGSHTIHLLTYIYASNPLIDIKKTVEFEMLKNKTELI